ncbi:MAG: homogentisate 1,2-dioxygenase [Ktedonobacterales bacterium]|nr:homogentisate 1,2-dioxygenase [Ktedonobacterales bacterium]
MSYHRLGQVPPKRHTQFRQPDGSLYTEELFGEEGFVGMASLLYHQFPPTRVSGFKSLGRIEHKVWQQEDHRHHHFKTHPLPKEGDPVGGRKVLMFNSDLTIGLVRPSEKMEYFYRNAMADEMLFVHNGQGMLETTFGTVPYEEGDYLIIPRGTTYRVSPLTEETRMLTVEAFGGSILPPKRYRNNFGQLLESSPYCERDFRVPMELPQHEERGQFEVRIKVNDELMAYQYDFHPLDVVGWDGYLYPYAFNIRDFEPITYRIHGPPPTHQTFEAPNFVVCSFVPRKLDYHPLSVPAPYAHSNIDSDEMMYYVNGNYSARKNIEEGSITLHPRGIAHGPQPGAAEASIGKDYTDELVVMVDTFRPLLYTETARDLDDASYPMSWLG